MKPVKHRTKILNVSLLFMQVTQDNDVHIDLVIPKEETNSFTIEQPNHDDVDNNEPDNNTATDVDERQEVTHEVLDVLDRIYCNYSHFLFQELQRRRIAFIRGEIPFEALRSEAMKRFEELLINKPVEIPASLLVSHFDLYVNADLNM